MKADQNELEGGQLGRQRASQHPRKPYSTPVLIVHGTVEDITKGLGTKGSDGFLGSRVL